jgi:hypothetical protein
MKFLLIAKPVQTPQYSLEQRLSMLKAGEEWVGQKLKDGTFDCAYNFVERGGVVIVNIDSVEAAHAFIMEIPFSVLYDWEARPLLETMQGVKHGIARLEKAIELQKQAS